MTQASDVDRWVEEQLIPRAMEKDAGAALELWLGPEDLGLLEEALRLTEQHSPVEVLRVALRELVERQRFLSWVHDHEHRGTA